jgi:SAM-dependent methyltransferase
MVELDSSAIRKRQAWATRAGTESYVQEMGAYALARDEEIIRDLLGRGPGHLLDMPCGTGRYLDLEKELGFRITAADYSPTMLAVARKHDDVQFVQADAFNPPFAAETFDAILISRLLFHYRNPEAIIGALLPSLKHGGRMIFDTLNAFSLRWSASRVIELFRRDAARRLYFERPAAMAGKIEALGLRVLRRRSAYFLPTRLYRSLPGAAIRVADCLEKATPASCRVLMFWEVARP